MFNYPDRNSNNFITDNICPEMNELLSQFVKEKMLVKTNKNKQSKDVSEL